MHDRAYLTPSPSLPASLSLNTAPSGNTAVSTFSFRGFDLRCVLIDGDPWFAVADACDALGIKSRTDAFSKLRSTLVSRKKLSTSKRARPNNMVNEEGLYRLIFQSRKPEAREFQDWDFGTVLPAIRKDGGYIEDEEKVATLSNLLNPLSSQP